MFTHCSFLSIHRHLMLKLVAVVDGFLVPAGQEFTAKIVLLVHNFLCRLEHPVANLCGVAEPCCTAWPPTRRSTLRLGRRLAGYCRPASVHYPASTRMFLDQIVSWKIMLASLLYQQEKRDAWRKFILPHNRIYSYLRNTLSIRS